MASENRKSPTIIDIAKKAGVSKSTVSRALTGSPLISKKTQDRIQKLARKMGYRPNMIFSIMGSGNRLKNKDTSLIPIAYLYEPTPNTEHPDAMRMMEYPYMLQEAKNYGFHLEPYNLREIKSAREFEEMLFNRGYCGVIIGRMSTDMPIVHELDLSEFTVVFNTNTAWENKYHRVTGNVMTALEMAWDRMVESGYRRIAASTCRHEPSLPDDNLRVAALLARQHRDRDLVEPIPPFEEDPGSNKEFAEWIETWKPDAVIGFHTGQYYQLINMGYRIPEDIGYAGLLLNTEDRWSKNICGIPNQTEEVAEISLSVLDQEIRKRIHGIPEHVLSVLIEPKWHEGGSLRMK